MNKKIYIGYNEQPTGRLGNVLLQYLFLRELADKYNCCFFYPELQGSKYFNELGETVNYHTVKKNFFYRKCFCYQDILKSGLEQFALTIQRTSKTIVLKPPILGFTFDALYTDPNNYLSIKEEYKNAYFCYENRFVVALHFRGTDFSSWDPNACLDCDYYINAIEYCINKFRGENLYFSLFTDDLTIDSYKNVVNYLKEFKYDFNEGNPKRCLGEECYNISISDVVISSPSTFAIASSLIGKQKRIIHSKKWCDYCVDKHDRVWTEMVKNKNRYYVLECLI